jgi:hypothetical protein
MDDSAASSSIGNLKESFLLQAKDLLLAAELGRLGVVLHVFQAAHANIWSELA